MYQPSQQAIKPIYKPQAHIKIGMIPIQKTSSKKKKQNKTEDAINCIAPKHNGERSNTMNKHQCQN